MRGGAGGRSRRGSVVAMPGRDRRGYTALTRGARVAHWMAERATVEEAVFVSPSPPNAHLALSRAFPEITGHETLADQAAYLNGLFMRSPYALRYLTNATTYIARNVAQQADFGYVNTGFYLDTAAGHQAALFESDVDCLTGCFDPVLERFPDVPRGKLELLAKQTAAALTEVAFTLCGARVAAALTPLLHFWSATAVVADYAMQVRDGGFNFDTMQALAESVKAAAFRGRGRGRAVLSGALRAVLSGADADSAARGAAGGPVPLSQVAILVLGMVEAADRLPTSVLESIQLGPLWVSSVMASQPGVTALSDMPAALAAFHKFDVSGVPDALATTIARVLGRESTAGAMPDAAAGADEAWRHTVALQLASALDERLINPDVAVDLHGVLAKRALRPTEDVSEAVAAAGHGAGAAAAHAAGGWPMLAEGVLGGAGGEVSPHDATLAAWCRDHELPAFEVSAEVAGDSDNVFRLHTARQLARWLQMLEHWQRDPARQLVLHAWGAAHPDGLATRSGTILRALAAHGLDSTEKADAIVARLIQCAPLCLPDELLSRPVRDSAALLSRLHRPPEPGLVSEQALRDLAHLHRAVFQHSFALLGIEVPWREAPPAGALDRYVHYEPGRWYDPVELQRAADAGVPTVAVVALPVDVSLTFQAFAASLVRRYGRRDQTVDQFVGGIYQAVLRMVDAHYGDLLPDPRNGTYQPLRQQLARMLLHSVVQQYATLPRVLRPYFEGLRAPGETLAVPDVTGPSTALVRFTIAAAERAEAAEIAATTTGWALPQRCWASLLEVSGGTLTAFGWGALAWVMQRDIHLTSENTWQIDTDYGALAAAGVFGGLGVTLATSSCRRRAALAASLEPESVTGCMGGPHLRANNTIAVVSGVASVAGLILFCVDSFSSGFGAASGLVAFVALPAAATALGPMAAAVLTNRATRRAAAAMRAAVAPRERELDELAPADVGLGARLLPGASVQRIDGMLVGSAADIQRVLDGATVGGGLQRGIGTLALLGFGSSGHVGGLAGSEMVRTDSARIADAEPAI